MFGCLFGLIRTIASLVLAVLLFFGFFGYVLISTFRDNFLTKEFYTESLSENSVYDRIYDEVLVDPEYETTKDRLLGDIDVSQQAVARVGRRIIPPNYLQDQVEGAIEGLIDYLNDKDIEDPQIFIDLGPPLERVKPTLFDYMDERIDGLEDVPVTTIDELETKLEDLFRTLEDGKIPTQAPFIEDPEQLVASYVDDTITGLEEVSAPTQEDFQREIESIYKEISAGEIPTRVPSIASIPIPDRLAAYDLALRTIRNDPNFPQEALAGLEQQEDVIKAQLSTPSGDVKGALEAASRSLTEPAVELFIDDAYDMAFEALKKEGISNEALSNLDKDRDRIKELLGMGQIKEVLKLGGRSLAEPLIDDAIEELRENLDDQDRIDLVAELAEHNGQTTQDFLDDIDPVRDVVDRSEFGGVLAIVAIIVATVLMMGVNFPHLASGMRWPGMTMLLTGLPFLILGLATGILSDRFDDVLKESDTDVSNIPPTMVNVITDVLTSLASDVAGGFIGPSIVIMVIGFVLLVGSIVMRWLRIPFFSR